MADTTPQATENPATPQPDEPRATAGSSVPAPPAPITAVTDTDTAVYHPGSRLLRTLAKRSIAERNRRLGLWRFRFVSSPCSEATSSSPFYAESPSLHPSRQASLPINTNMAADITLIRQEVSGFPSLMTNAHMGRICSTQRRGQSIHGNAIVNTKWSTCTSKSKSGK